MATISIQQLSHGLKEWAVAVEALEAGKTIALLRKGGIREANKNFQLQYRQVWLYPTYEHQKPHLLKPEYAENVTLVKSGWHPETIRIGSYAEITQVLSISDRFLVEALQPYHIWQPEMIGERLKWKPQQPLSVLLLRVYRLPQPRMIPFDKSYRGCKSWIDLTQPITVDRLTPVLDDNTYGDLVKQIINAIDCAKD